VLYLRLIILSVGGDVSVDSETLLMTNFVNLKIKSAQSFRDTHKNKIYIYIFIKMNTHINYASLKKRYLVAAHEIN
jgi:hypothetical protein